MFEDLKFILQALGGVFFMIPSFLCFLFGFMTLFLFWIPGFPVKFYMAFPLIMVGIPLWFIWTFYEKLTDKKMR